MGASLNLRTPSWGSYHSLDPDTPQQEPQNYLDLLSETPVPSTHTVVESRIPPLPATTHRLDANPGTLLSAAATPAPTPPAQPRFPKKGILGTWNPSNLQTHSWDFSLYPNTAHPALDPKFSPWCTKDAPGPLYPRTLPHIHSRPLPLFTFDTLSQDLRHPPPPIIPLALSTPSRPLRHPWAQNPSLPEDSPLKPICDAENAPTGACPLFPVDLGPQPETRICYKPEHWPLISDY